MQEILDSLIAKIKADGKYKFPEGKTQKLADRINLHYNDEVNEDQAKAFLKEKAPNQRPEEYAYELKNFRIFTRRILLKIMGMFSKVANEQNYQYMVGDSDLNEYLKSDYPFYGSFENYISSTLLDSKLLDSNAVRVTKPLYIPKVQIGENLIYDDTQNVKAIDEIFESKRVVHFESENLFIGLSYEKSEVTYNNKQVQDGLIFDIYDKTTIYKLKQVGRKIDYNFEFEVYYVHNLNYLPCSKLKGKEVIKEGKIIYNSPLNFVTDDLDILLKMMSNLNVGTMSRVFAERVEVIDHDCVTCRGSGIEYMDVAGVETEIVCRACNGTTALPRPSVLSTKIIKADENKPETFKQIYPGVTYVSPPIEGLNFLKAQIEDKEKQVFETLNQKLTNTIVSGQTATGERIDKEEQYTMLMQWANQLFENAELSLAAHCGYWSSDVSYNFIRPITYNIRTEEDLNTEINESQNTPSYIRAEMYKQYVNKRFAENSTLRKHIDLIAKVDRLFGMTLSEKQGLQNVQPWEMVLSESIINFIDNIRDFDKKNEDVQISELIEMAQSKVTKVATVEDII